MGLPKENSQGIVLLLTQTGVHKWELKECYIPPHFLHLSQGLRKFTPCRVTWGPQLNVFQPTTSEKTDWRHKFHICGVLRCPTIAPRMYNSKPQISEHESHWLTNFIGTKGLSTQSNGIPASSSHPYGLAYMTVGSYLTPFAGKKWGNLLTQHVPLSC